MNKATEYYKMSKEDKTTALKKLYAEYFILRQKKVMGDSMQTHLLKSTRRNIARLKTIMHNQ